MKYNAFRSIVASQKTGLVALQRPSDSFFVTSTRVAPFIEPGFSKVEFPNEKPSILLVSAVGASGKTTAAHALSFDLKLPVLDLSKHKAVGDNTLTGILTTAYPIDKVGGVLEGLRTGTHGIIIDGIDEGRSKTTEQGFEAFLDDLMQRSEGATSTVIVVFGRSQVLLSTWLYLADHGADVALVQIDSFNLKQAKAYIDSLVTDTVTSQTQAYEHARDEVLSKLDAAFSLTENNDKNLFLSFIGYPPVLDAIATLLREERNYYRIHQTLSGGIGGQLEIGLLIRIADYLLDRDHKEKALPNFIEEIASLAGGSVAQDLRTSLYSPEEQCARVLSRALNREFPRQVIEDNILNERYEKAADNWCQDHPFLDDTRVRNAVFEAVSVTRCTLSPVREYRDLAHDYTAVNPPTYHLLYILNELVEHEIDVSYFNMLIQSCSEFLGMNADVSIAIDGNSWEESNGHDDTGAELTITVEFPEHDQERTFVLKGTVGTQAIPLGPYLVNTSVTLPCPAVLSGTPAIRVIGNCSISAQSVYIDTPDLILHQSSRQESTGVQGNTGLFINTQKAEGHANSIGAGRIEIQCVEHALGYPLARFVKKMPRPPFVDPMLQEKYRRLRRILLEFAAHKKGRLAKYRDKIEHQRVLQNQLGEQILQALINEGILQRGQKFYFVDPGQCDGKLEISWHQLRQYQSSSKLEAFLKGVS